MAMRKCPSCGAPYNGRKCKNCYYERFVEEISHGMHTHEGEPLVIKSPERKPRTRKNPLDCDRRTRKVPKWLTTILVWILVINLVPWVIDEIQAGIDRARVPEPVVSSQATRLWEGEEITVWLEQNRENWTSTEIPILVENNSRDDIAVTAWEIYLGDYQTSESFLYVEADKRSWGRGYLYLEEAELKEAAPVEKITITLDIFDNDSYESIAIVESVELPY